MHREYKLSTRRLLFVALFASNHFYLPRNWMDNRMEKEKKKKKKITTELTHDSSINSNFFLLLIVRFYSHKKPA